MSPRWNEYQDDLDEPTSSEFDATLIPVPLGNPRKIPARLKHKDSGFRVEKTTDGKRWKLEKYYRDETTMRNAFRACQKRGSGKHSWHPYTYRMVFPDGRVIPGMHDTRYSEYHLRWPDA